MTWRWTVISKDHMINDEIRAKEVRLVGAEGEQIGITPIREALQMAIDLNLDLVNVAHRLNRRCAASWTMANSAMSNKRKKKPVRTRKLLTLKYGSVPILRSTIIKRSFVTWLRFLKEGDKVKCSVRYRGREIAHAAIGQKILERVKVEVAELCTVERQPKLEGRSMIMILAPKA